MGVSGIKISLRCENFAFTFLKMFLIERADINMFQERIFTVKPVCFTHARHCENYVMRSLYQLIISHIWPILNFKELRCLTKPLRV